MLPSAQPSRQTAYLLQFDQREPAPALMNNEYHFVIERDSDGLFVASVPQLPGCHTQARTLEELAERIQEAIELWLGAEGQPQEPLDFVGIQKIRVGS